MKLMIAAFLKNWVKINWCKNYAILILLNQLAILKYKIDYKYHSTLRDTVGIWGCEGVWFFLWCLSFFIISGKYYRYGELPVIINCRFLGWKAVGFFLFFVGEKSISIVLGFSLLGLYFIRFKPASTKTSPSSSNAN